MNSLIKKEIKNLIKSFDKTEDFYEKGYILTLIDYLSKVVPNDKDILSMKEVIHSKVNLISKELLLYSTIRRDEIGSYMIKSSSFFNEHIESIEKKETSNHQKLVSLSHENISYLISDFLDSIDSNIYKFYDRMCQEGRILYSIENNTALTSLDNSKSVIFVEKLENLEDVMVLLHELAHAYYMYINNYLVKDRESLPMEIKDEIPAKIMEQEFIKYLRNNGVIESSLVLEDLFDAIMYECDNRRYNFENLKYLVASNIALSVQDKDINLTEYYKYIYETDIYTIIKEKGLGKVIKK